MHTLALVALLGGATGIGFAPVLVRFSEVGPIATAFYRILFSLPWLWAWQWWERQGDNPARRPSTQKEYQGLALTGLFFIGDLALWHWSLQFTTIANSTLLTNFAPLFVSLGAWWLLRERVGGRFVFAMLLALGGAVLLVGERWEARHGLGDALAFSTAIFYAAYQLNVKQLRVCFSTATIMFWSGVFACVGFAILAVLTGETLVPHTAKGWLVLLALAVVSHLGGQTLIAYAIGHLPAAFASLGLLLQPVVAAGLAWVIFGETLSAVQILGGLVVLFGIGLARQNREKTRN